MRFVFILMLCFISGCSVLKEDNVLNTWNHVKAEYNYNGEMPIIVIVDGPIISYKNGKPVHCAARYFDKLNLIQFDKFYSDEQEILEHEFRHACGDDLGESIAGVN